MKQALKLLILLGVIWGSGYAIARFAMLHGVPPVGYALWQSIGPALFLIALCLYRKVRVRFSRHLLVYFLITGLLGIALPNTTMYVVAPHLPAGVLAVVVNIVPIIIYPVALLIQQERFFWTRIIGVFFGVLGVMLIAIPKASLPNASMLSWVLIALISPFCFALSAIYASKYRPDEPSLVLSAGMLTAAAILLIPFALMTHQSFMLSSAHFAGSVAVVVEVVLSSIGYILLFDILKSAGPVFYSLVAGVVSITGLFWGYIFFSEKLTVTIFMAVLSILIGLYFISKRIKAYQH